MSWVSILEDSVKRLESDLHMLSEDVPPTPEPVTTQQWQAAVNLIARGQLILADASQHLELATNPSMDLAFQLKVSAAEAASWQTKVADFQRTCLSLMSRLSLSEADNRRLKEEVACLRTEVNGLTAKLEVALNSNPSGVYAAFGKGSHRKRQ